MIIADEHKFVFIHIPKCAGTFVRRNIQPYDSYANKYWGVKTAADGRSYDVAHLTLAELRAIEPETFAKVAAYRSLAVVRAPGERLVSSFLEYMRNYLRIHKSETDPRVIREALDGVIARLAAGEGATDHRLTHFKRQIDSLVLDGQSPISHVYGMNQMPAFIADVEASLGMTFDTETKHNEAPPQFANHGLRNLGKAIINPIAKTGLIPSTKELNRRFSRSPFVRAFYRKAGDAIAFNSPAIKSFIADYYSEDARMYAFVSANAGGVTGEELARFAASAETDAVAS